MAKSKARQLADIIVGDGTLDGRDVSVDGTKLDGIETAADVTDTANVTAAGALMDSEVTNLAQVKAFDSSDYATSAQGTTADSALQNVVEDTSPQLGGNLDLNSSNITGTGNINITGNLTTTGYIAGPATFTIDPAAVGDNTGTLVVAGNLQVDGTTTTINSTTMTVDDLNLTLASGALNAAAANGAGITVDGASATITYDGTNDEWDFNKPLNVTGAITSSGEIDVNLSAAGKYFEGGSGNIRRLSITSGTNVSAHAKHTFDIASSNGKYVFQTNSEDRLTLDSSGATFAGTISSGAITSSSTIQGTAYLVGSTVIVNTNRDLTNIGTISSGAITSTGVSSFSNGTSVGNVELHTNSIGTDEAGILFQPNSAYRCVHPVSMTSTSHTSDISLGWSNNKWKDIYLAGYVKADSGYQIGTTTVIDSSRVVQNVTLGHSNTGARFETNDWMYDTGGKARFYFTGGGTTFFGSDNGYVYRSNSDIGRATISNDGGINLLSGGDGLVGSTVALAVSGTTVIDSSRNLTNIGTISSGAITSSGDFSTTGSITSTDGSSTFQISGDNSSNTYLTATGEIRVRPSGTSINKLVIGSNGNITTAGDIKTTGLLEVASTQPRILLDRSDGSYRWNIYNGDGSGNFPISTFNIANNAGTAVITALDNGNVGIGNTSPTSNLTIGSAQSDGLEFTYDGTNAYRHRIANYWNSNTDSRMDFEIGRSGGVAPQTILSVGYATNVGIGITAPSQSLQVDSKVTGTNQGVPSTSGTNQNGILRLTPGDLTYGETLDFGMNVGPTYAWIQSTNKDGLGTNYNLSLNPNGGNVGIGTNSPDEKLHIHSTTDTTIKITDATLGSETYGGYIKGFGVAGSGGRLQLGAIDNDVENLAIEIQEQANGLHLRTKDGNNGATARRLTILGTSGNVGIGTASPYSKLNVLGTSASTYTGNGPGATIRASQGTDGNWIASDVDGKFAYFGVDGNDAKFAAYNYATTAEMGMVLGQSRMYIKNTGQVGIGTTNIDHNASVEIGNSAPNTGVTTLRLTNSVNNKGQRIDFEDDNGSRAFTLSHDNGSNLAYMGTLISEPFLFYTEGLERAQIKANGEFNLSHGLKLNGTTWNNSDVMKAYRLEGPAGSTTLTRTVNVNTYWGFPAQGGAFMFMLHGWQTDAATGMIHWHNNGSGLQIITGVYLNEFHTASGLTVSVAKGTGDYDIDITLTSTHINTHGWYWKVWA